MDAIDCNGDRISSVLKYQLKYFRIDMIFRKKHLFIIALQKSIELSFLKYNKYNFYGTKIILLHLVQSVDKHFKNA